MKGVRHLLLQETAPSGMPGGLLYVAELHHTAVTPKMDHLVCFLPGDRALCDLQMAAVLSVPACKGMARLLLCTI